MLVDFAVRPDVSAVRIVIQRRSGRRVVESGVEGLPEVAVGGLDGDAREVFIPGGASVRTHPVEILRANLRREVLPSPFEADRGEADAQDHLRSLVVQMTADIRAFGLGLDRKSTRLN